MKIAIIVFPGSNCDQDCFRSVKKITGADVFFLWHKETSLKNADAIIVPGGFSYGDYLRSGAIARFSPVMKEVIAAAGKGLPVLGICNGFQILTEAGLLPGVLMRNQSLHFICDTLSIKLETTRTVFTKKSKEGTVYQLPIAHMDGNYFIDADGLKSLQDNQQIVFRYVGNPNGSLADIAGVCNKAGNIMGLMPHPERVCEDVLGGTDGKFIFESLAGK